MSNSGLDIINEMATGNKKVKGIVIAARSDQRLRYALEMVPDTELLLYRINFSLFKPRKD